MTDLLDAFQRTVDCQSSYEGDFLYIASFIAAFETALRAKTWTFIELRSSLEAQSYTSFLRDALRRCLGLSGRTVIMGSDGLDASRLDRGLYKFLQEKSLESSLLLSHDTPDLSKGLHSLDVESRTRIVRLVFQSALDSPNSSITSSGTQAGPLIGKDSTDCRYFLLKDCDLEVGCWKEEVPCGKICLIATTTHALCALVATLRSSRALPPQSVDTCVFCRKRLSGDVVSCKACSSGRCHFACLPPDQLVGIEWCCGDSCYQVNLASLIQAFVDEVEPLQKAAMRKRRRLQTEVRSLNISGLDTGSGRGSRARGRTDIDYSFRNYDKLMQEAIRKSERGEDVSSSEEEPSRLGPRNLSREQRMAERERRNTGASSDRIEVEYAGESTADLPEEVTGEPQGIDFESDLLSPQEKHIISLKPSFEINGEGVGDHESYLG
jgi:hypothetical protein